MQLFLPCPLPPPIKHHTFNCDTIPPDKAHRSHHCQDHLLLLLLFWMHHWLRSIRTASPRTIQCCPRGWRPTTAASGSTGVIVVGDDTPLLSHPLLYAAEERLDKLTNLPKIFHARQIHDNHLFFFVAVETWS